ncbi:MAG: class I SAM-dependent RNA methyltransferase [Armatimonadetes bacterium]|nr:class I SAM-dependent RNA methyltransferase [Armatimonadota bacterium]
MLKLSLVATCAFGLEAVVARELQALGYDTRSDNGSVWFEADELAICRANLWLRSADRLWLRLGEFPAGTFEELFQGVRQLPWPDWLSANAEFPVSGISHASQLTSVPACQAVVKKAIVESLKARYRMDWFPEDGPRFPIRMALIHNQCTISLDTSGSGLHRRGYRVLNAEAPLRETLAAGLVQLTYWRPERLLADPMCGSGTILLEAALWALKRAPGLNRTFAAEGWPWVPPAAWPQARAEAEELFDRTTRLNILGSDHDSDVLKLARYHLRAAELSDRGIEFQRRPVQEFRSRQKYGVLITNPPYGQRQSELIEVERLYRELGRVWEPLRETWSGYFLTSHPGFPRLFGHRPARRRKVYNGMIPCIYYQYPGPRPAR